VDRRSALLALAGFAGISSTLQVGSLAYAQAGRVQLIMFDEPGCPWCRRWRAEVGKAFANSPEARRAPLRTIDIRERLPAGITFAGPIRGTPTFVLVENGREVGRIFGYPGADFWWGMLGDLMKKLKSNGA
jgi:hypothetical protein